MLLHPSLCIEFDGGDLGPSEASSDKRRKRLAGIVATGSGYDHPEVSAVGVLRNATAAEINRPQLRLSGHIALFGRLGEPPNSLALVQFDAFTQSRIGDRACFPQPDRPFQQFA